MDHTYRPEIYVLRSERWKQYITESLAKKLQISHTSHNLGPDRPGMLEAGNTHMRIWKLVIWAQLFGSGIASADLIYLNSQAGLATSAGVTAVAISPHPSWQPNHPANPGDPTNNSAVWISYADTGYGGSTFQPYGGSKPVVTIYDTFQSDPGTLHLNVWADDTADVLLDGAYLYHAVFTQSICSGQPIGCRPDDVGVIDAPLSAGNHTLEFVLYQVGTGTNTY